MSPFVAAPLGLVVLLVGAEALVRGASSLALRLGLTPLVVGLTVVAFGTSAPELVVSVKAALTDRPAIAMGNVVGSNIANIGLILGLCALVRPIGVQTQLVRLDLPLLLGVSVLAPVLMHGGLLRFEALLLALALVGYVGVLIYLARRGGASANGDQETTQSAPLPLALVFVLVGLAALVFGADLFVDGASEIAQRAGVSERVIGLTLVAVGTSLPELAASLVAAFRRMGDLAVGNVVGSNIFNLLGILGVAGLVKPLGDGALLHLDLGAMVLFAVLLLPLARSSLRLGRREGLLFLALYGGYLALLARGG